MQPQTPQRYFPETGEGSSCLDYPEEDELGDVSCNFLRKNDVQSPRGVWGIQSCDEGDQSRPSYPPSTRQRVELHHLSLVSTLNRNIKEKRSHEKSHQTMTQQREGKQVDTNTNYIWTKMKMSKGFRFIIIFHMILALLQVRLIILTMELPMINNCVEDLKPSTTSVYQPFNSTNPHAHSWCPYAKCQNSPMCSPCNQRFLFIVSTPRSGSTSLLKMINHLPNVRLSGENQNAFYWMSRVPNKLQRFPNNGGVFLLDQHNDLPFGAWWHNGIPAQSMACPMQGIMHTINPPPEMVQKNAGLNGNPFPEEYDKDLIMGMKTIRVQDGDWGPKEASTFIKEHFPCSKILVNIRSNSEKEQAKSQIDNFRFINHTEIDIEGDNKFLREFSANLDTDMVRLVDLDDWKTDISVLNAVVGWLGFEGCNYTSIAHENQNGFEGDESFRNPFNGSDCHYPD